MDSARPIRLGLRENLPQFTLLVGVNALVGGMIGQERTALPLLAEQDFGLTAMTATLTFIMAFGVVKAAANFVARRLHPPGRLHPFFGGLQGEDVPRP